MVADVRCPSHVLPAFTMCTLLMLAPSPSCGLSLLVFLHLPLPSIHCRLPHHLFCGWGFSYFLISCINEFAFSIPLSRICFFMISRKKRNAVFFKILFSFFIQQVLISYLFYTYECIYVNPNLPIHPTTTTRQPLLSPLGVHTFVLYICVSISALQTGSSVPFF